MKSTPEHEVLLNILSMTVQPAVLAGILDISVPMVYQGRQDGKLPPSQNATYLQCIHHYIDFYKRKMASKASSTAEAKLLQDIRNGMAKEELQYLEIKEKRQELLDVATLTELFHPIFMLVHSGLSNLARKHPELVGEVDQLLESWSVLGERIAEKAKMDGNMYVKAMLEREVELPEVEEDLKNRFGLESQDES